MISAKQKKWLKENLLGSQNDMADTLLKNGFKSCGHGSEKTVYSKDDLDYVVKLHPVDTVYETPEEVPDCLKKYFAHSERINEYCHIQEKVETGYITLEEVDEIKDLFRPLEILSNHFSRVVEGIYLLMVEELFDFNMGKKENGQIVIIDC